jgi:plasmid replication initiation protein
MKSSSNELIKHSATIHVSNSLSLLERKLYNILLKNAFHELLKADIYHISMRELKRNLGRDGNTDNEIKEAIEKLVGTKLKWNIFDKDSQNEWGVTTVLAAASIERGICSYEYSSKLKMFLAKPNVYARLNLLVQREFRSKHALALWEFLIDKLCTSKQDNVSTEWIDIDAYRTLLNVGGQYTDFKVLNRDAIKKPLDEINKVSDIEVEVAYKKHKKRVDAVSFSVKRKSNFQFSLPINEVKTLPQVMLKNSDVATILKNDFKIPGQIIEQILTNYNLKQITDALNYVNTQSKNFPIKNLAAYTQTAIKNSWKLDKALENKENSSWVQVQDLLKLSLGEAIFNSWIKDIKFDSYEDRKILLQAPSKLQKQRLETVYLPKILRAWKEIDPTISYVELN